MSRRARALRAAGIAIRFALAVGLAAATGASAAAEDAAAAGATGETGPDARKAQREEELATLTRDIEISADRQAAIAREIRAIDRDKDALNADLLRTAQRIRNLERQLSATEDRLRRLVENEDTVRASLAERQDVLAEVLSALQRIGGNPPPALAVRPSDALSAVRGALLLNAVMPEIHVEAQALASDLAELRRLKTSIAAERDRLAADATRLEEERSRVELLIASKRRQRETTEAGLEQERQRAAELAERATTLKALIASLEEEISAAKKAAAEAEKVRAAAPSADPFADPGRLAPAIAFADAKGRLALPVAGTPIRSFGEDDGFGGMTQGESIGTRSGAQVVAPTDGWVVYAGPFRSYGQLLILNAGDGYHVLLAGMERIDVELGQFVLAGEPVAVMGETRLASAATLDLGATQPVLYVEFRKDGSAIDPTPWWDRADNEKGRG